jgi:peptidylprolyl isomerase
VTGAAGQKPAITIADGSPPATLQMKDITVGTGAAAKTGDNVTVQYVGVSFTTKQQFDASWDNGSPFQFQLGGQVIAGWNQGVVGMQVGGRRLLVIPPDLGYGAQGYPPKIPPNDTLVFVVDLVSIP